MYCVKSIVNYFVVHYLWNKYLLHVYIYTLYNVYLNVTGSIVTCKVVKRIQVIIFNNQTAINYNKYFSLQLMTWKQHFNIIFISVYQARQSIIQKPKREREEIFVQTCDVTQKQTFHPLCILDNITGAQW